jgi:hypothetical protein
MISLKKKLIDDFTAFSGFTIDLLYMLGDLLNVNFEFELASEEEPESSDAPLGEGMHVLDQCCGLNHQLECA